MIFSPGLFYNKRICEIDLLDKKYIKTYYININKV